jgi:hypothetical protein
MRNTLRMAQSDENGDQWAHDLVKRVGAAMKQSRGDQSARWLSDRTAELGYRISPTVIAKLDSGHRGGVLSVAELLVLAAALSTAPLALLFPDALDDVTILPGKPMRGIDAVGWFTGVGTVAPEGVSVHGPNNQRIRLVWQLVQIEQTLEIQRHNLVQQEGGLEWLELSKEAREHMEQQEKHSREAIKSLEFARDRVVHDYRMVTDD